MREILALARSTRRLATARACVEWLGPRGGTQMIEELAAILADEDGELASCAAGALATAGGAEAQRPLLRALGVCDAPDVLVAMAKALGRVGSPSAVMTLRATADRVSLPAFNRAVRQAIAEIQARLQGAEPGQLSLAAEQAGQVSLVEDDDARGRLTVPEAAANQLCTKNSSVPAGVADPSRKNETR